MGHVGHQPQSSSGPRNQIAQVAAEIVAIAERQAGLVAWRQLVGSGLGRATVTRWVDRGQLHRRHPGVYSVGHRRISDRGRLIAGLLYAGPGAALGGATAAAHCGLIDPSPRAPVEVWTPHRRKPVPGVVPKHRPTLTRVIHDGLPVTPIPDTLLALATKLSLLRLRKALAEADYRGLLHPAEIEATLGRNRPGSRTLRQALQAHLPALAHTRSELEVEFLRLCERAELPLPKLNVRIGPFTVDALFADHHLVIELDGGAAHGRPAAVIQDRSRELYLRERGYRIIRYSWWQVFDASDRVVADLRRVLAETQPSASL
jgi:very-short-patch-repair endonuclease